jgi:hypothetical protein
MSIVRVDIEVDVGRSSCNRVHASDAVALAMAEARKWKYSFRNDLVRFKSALPCKEQKLPGQDGFGHFFAAGACNRR